MLLCKVDHIYCGRRKANLQPFKRTWVPLKLPLAMRKLLQSLLTNAVQSLHKTYKGCRAKIMKMSCNIAHEAEIEKKKHSKLWPRAPSGKGRSAKSGKRKEITVGKKKRTMERESGEGSLNCNKPRAKQKARTHTQTHTPPWHMHPDYTSQKTDRALQQED